MEITAAGNLQVTLISPNLRGEGKRKKPLYLCCHDAAIGDEGRKYITPKKYLSVTAFVLVMVGLVL